MERDQASVEPAPDSVAVWEPPATLADVPAALRAQPTDQGRHKRAAPDRKSGIMPCTKTLKCRIDGQWRGGRAVECTGLENRRTLTGLVSSNLTLSARRYENYDGVVFAVHAGSEAEMTPAGAAISPSPPDVMKIMMALYLPSTPVAKPTGRAPF